MEHTNKMKNLIGCMTTLSALGLAMELAVSASIGSSVQSILLIFPVVFSAILVLLGVVLFYMAKDLPDGELLRENTICCLLVLGVQTSYCLLMLTGKLELGTIGHVFALFGYFSVFHLAYDNNKKKTT